MFMTQYTDLWEALDTIAERIRALGAFAPGSASEILDAAFIRPDNGVPDASTMVSNLARGHETLAKAIRDAIASAEQAGDDVTVDLLIQRATIADKTAWMLRASL
jgi:starvation-inducible DNA-binding protein